MWRCARRFLRRARRACVVFPLFGLERFKGPSGLARGRRGILPGIGGVALAVAARGDPGVLVVGLDWSSWGA